MSIVGTAETVGMRFLGSAGNKRKDSWRAQLSSWRLDVVLALHVEIQEWPVSPLNILYVGHGFLEVAV